MNDVVTEIECLRIKGTSRQSMQEKITVESHLNLFVNDDQVSSFIHSEGFEEQLVTGYLLSSGIITDRNQIERIAQNGNDFRIWISGAKSKPKPVKTQLKLSHDELLDVRDALTKNQTNHYATRGFHGAILWEIPTGKWFMCEDIGRHNAVDKVIGYGVQNGYAISQSMVLLSGRLVSNIVSKCRNSGIPLMASMTVATDGGIREAVESNMTIIGSLSENGFWLYNEGVVKIT